MEEGIVNRMPAVFRCALLVALLALLAACGLTQKPKPQATEGVTKLTVESPSKTFFANKPFAARVTIMGVRPQAQLEVFIEGAGSVSTDVTRQVLTADGEGKAALTFNATISGPGLSSILVSARVPSTKETLSGTLDVLMNGSEVGPTAASLGGQANSGSPVDINAYYNALPRVIDPLYFVDYERKKHQNKQIALPQTFVLDKVTHKEKDGSVSQPYSAITYMVPDSGGGTPLPGEIGDKPQATATGVKPQGWGCDIQYDRATVRFTQTIDGAEKPLARGTKVYVFDDNQGYGLKLLSTGPVGDNGYLSFDRPRCDTSTYWDNSPVDLRFRVESTSMTNRIDEMWVADAFGRLAPHAWETLTYWDLSLAQVNQLSINLSGRTVNADNANALRLWFKMNLIYNHVVSQNLVPAPVFPVALLFPDNGIGGNSYAFVARLHIKWDQWRDSIFSHEFGHEVNYATTGGFNYQTYNNPVMFDKPYPCLGCLTHDVYSARDPTAGYIEGWADFFADWAATTLPQADVMPFTYFGFENTFGYPASIENEAGVAGWFWDLWDSAGTANPDQDGDGVALSMSQILQIQKDIFQSANTSQISTFPDGVRRTWNNLKAMTGAVPGNTAFQNLCRTIRLNGLNKSSSPQLAVAECQ